MLLGGKGDSILAALILIFVFLLFSVTTIHFFACKKKMHSRCLQDYEPQLETCSFILVTVVKDIVKSSKGCRIFWT